MSVVRFHSSFVVYLFECTGLPFRSSAWLRFTTPDGNTPHSKGEISDETKETLIGILECGAFLVYILK
jgi:hypothetical protein